MIAPSAPFQALADDITWFVKCPELRMLHVTTSGADRALALKILARSEGHPSNHSPYFVLEDHVAKDDSGFLSRAHRVREVHEERRRVLAKEELSLGESAQVDDTVEPAVAFGKQLLACLAAQQNVPELTGLTVVLAPTVIGEVKRFCDDLIGLVRAPSLSQVRWMVLETEPARILEPLQASLHEALLTSTAIVPESDRRADMAARLEAMAKAPVGGSPHVQLGFAGPRHVVAPPRFSELGRDPQSPETKRSCSESSVRKPSWSAKEGATCVGASRARRSRPVTASSQTPWLSSRLRAQPVSRPASSSSPARWRWCWQRTWSRAVRGRERLSRSNPRRSAREATRS